MSDRDQLHFDLIGLRIAELPTHHWSGYEWEWSCSDDYHDGQYCEHPDEHEDLLIVSRTRLQAAIRAVLLGEPDAAKRQFLEKLREYRL